MESWVPCDQWQKGLEFIKKYPDIADALVYDNSAGSICFCWDCHSKRGDGEVYKRGGEPYQLPLLYSAYVVGKFKDDAEQQEKCANWVNAYHATSLKNLCSIARDGFKLRKPGDTCDDGTEVKIRIDDGRWLEDKEQTNPYTDEKYNFKVKRVYATPSIEYAERYIGLEDMQSGFCVVIQMRLKPGSYEVGPETVGAFERKEKISPHHDNGKIEFMIDNTDDMVVTRILIRYLKWGENPKAHGGDGGRMKIAT